MMSTACNSSLLEMEQGAVKANQCRFPVRLLCANEVCSEHEQPIILQDLAYVNAHVDRSPLSHACGHSKWVLACALALCCKESLKRTAACICCLPVRCAGNVSSKQFCRILPPWTSIEEGFLCYRLAATTRPQAGASAFCCRDSAMRIPVCTCCLPMRCAGNMSRQKFCRILLP